MEIVNLLAEIFDRAWNETAVLPLGRKFVLQYLPQLMQLDRLDLLTCSMKNFDRGENLSLLLSVPELWESMQLQDWSDLMKAMSPRPEVSVFDPTGCYVDMIFLIVELNLDGLQFALSQDELGVEDKRRIYRYCRATPHFEGIQKNDTNLDGENWCSAEQILNYRSKLLAQNENLIPTYSDWETFRHYADEIWTTNFGDS